jgi:hypothetical protein
VKKRFPKERAREKTSLSGRIGISGAVDDKVLWRNVRSQKRKIREEIKRTEEYGVSRVKLEKDC